MNMKFFWKNVFLTLILGSSLLSIEAIAAMVTATGAVTPSSITFTFTSVSLIAADNTQFPIVTDPFDATFKKTDQDFSTVTIKSITMPYGRYIGVNIGYLGARKVVLNGDLYQGVTAGGLTHNVSKLYTVGTGDASNANSVSTTTPAAPSAVTLTMGPTQMSSNQYFASAICLTSDPNAADCQPGDTKIVSAPNPTPSTSPSPAPSPTPSMTTVSSLNLNLLLDLYHAIGISGTSMSISNVFGSSLPIPTIGNPGASMHLDARDSGGNMTDVSLLFDGNKQLLWASAYASGNGLLGVCLTGGAAVKVTGVPGGSLLNSFGPNFVMNYNSTSGLLQFVGANNGSTSQGMNVLQNIKQQVGSTTLFTCVADSAASPPYLGFTYPSGTGSSGSTSFTVERVVDPGNILGVCSSSNTGFMASRASSKGGGTCTTATTSHGYP